MQPDYSYTGIGNGKIVVVIYWVRSRGEYGQDPLMRWLVVLFSKTGKGSADVQQGAMVHLRGAVELLPRVCQLGEDM